MLDCTYRVQIPHRTGQLARVMGAIASGEGLIGDVVTISIGRDQTIREITVEVRDNLQADRIAGVLAELADVRVLWYQNARAIQSGIQVSDMETVLREADVLVAATGRAGLIEPSMVRPGQVILALTNPDPEIDPQAAEAAGVAFAADGRSVNNVLGYPGIFRGSLAAGARMITLEMKLAAARAIADLAMGEEIVPNPLDQRVHDAVARAVREAADRSGVSRPEIATAAI